MEMQKLKIAKQIKINLLRTYTVWLQHWQMLNYKATSHLNGHHMVKNTDQKNKIQAAKKKLSCYIYYMY